MVELSILIVDDHEVVRQGVKRALATKLGAGALLEASTFAMAQELMMRKRPQVCIIDIHLPDNSGLELAGWARQEFSEMGIIIFSMAKHPEYILNAFDQGASAFVDKASPITELIGAIDSVCKDPLGFYCKDHEVALRYRRERISLTARELEILRLLPSGKRYEEMSTLLFISESTLKSHLQSIYRKLTVRNRVEAINEARRLQILLPGDPSSKTR